MSKKQCPCCLRKKVGPIKSRHRNTSYAIEELNYMTTCVHCIAEDDLEYAYLWAEYYNGSGAGGYSHYTDHLPNRTPWRNVF